MIRTNARRFGSNPRSGASTPGTIDAMALMVDMLWAPLAGAPALPEVQAGVDTRRTTCLRTAVLAPSSARTGTW